MTKIACKVLQKFDGKPVSCYAVAAENRSQKRSDLMIKAAIFDLDGTIGDTVESIAYSANRALRDIGYQAFPVENYKYYAGDGVDELVRRTLRDSGDTNCSQFEQMKSIYKAYFAKDCMYHVKPFPGICEMLSELKKRGIRIAVLSNKPHAQAIDVVESLFGKDYFDYIQGQTETIRRKPAPDGAFAIAEKFAVETGECLYVGDTNTDMQTGNAAHMHPVGVLWGFRDRKELEKNHSEYVIEKPQELIEILEKINGGDNK